MTTLPTEMTTRHRDAPHPARHSSLPLSLRPNPVPVTLPPLTPLPHPHPQQSRAREASGKSGKFHVCRAFGFGSVTCAS